MSNPDLIVDNQPVGGTGGQPFLTYSYERVRVIEAWQGDGSGPASDALVIKGIRLFWDNQDQPKSAGNLNGEHKSFDFEDGEKISSMTLQSGIRLDNIQFTTNLGRKFEAGGGGAAHHPTNENVGNGIFLGFHGHCGQDIDSAGAYFQR
ncbi:mannose-binding lectin [Aspergillus novoparasiticus]|uniref:Mannose-binding lectin n=1 Tax=Aspergillus novoparasiticus TaxID=986946 RepID=A0A5N6EVT2_9EURO|nr:mannose-binding lectin [Aspergillus novoparasiticus]